MKLLEVRSLRIGKVKVVKFARFCDHRGYFTEHFRSSDFKKHPDMEFLKDIEFVQANESRSRKGTIRGLHFQWNPYMGKLVRTLSGRMVDMALDIRKGSPTFGKIILYDMPADPNADSDEWIWVPPGFAHGNFFPEETLIEYFCTGHYNPDCEAGVSPVAEDIDWTLCEPKLKQLFDNIVRCGLLMSDKDKKGFSLNSWKNNKLSDNFIYDINPSASVQGVSPLKDRKEIV
jgi:dTDP-4-dehydrorhamnose 3,5-epimerase